MQGIMRLAGCYDSYSTVIFNLCCNKFFEYCEIKMTKQSIYNKLFVLTLTSVIIKSLQSIFNMGVNREK